MRGYGYVFIDFETRSRCDLTSCGTYRYATDPTTEILCAVFRLDGMTYRWTPQAQGYESVDAFLKLKNLLADPTTKWVAHNALFEISLVAYLLPRYGFPVIDPTAKWLSNWICTSALALELALPRGLEQAAQALGLQVQKDTVGRRLMLKFANPKAGRFHFDAKGYQRLVEYCETDVVVTEELFTRLKPYYSEAEHRNWVLTQVLNLRGIPVDTPTIDHVLKLAKDETEFLDTQFRELTELESARQVKPLLDFLEKNGALLPNLQKATIDRVLLDKSLPPNVRTALELRQQASKSSTAKYQALKNYVSIDGRVRDILVHHAASTGRFGGQGVQFQNLPRPAKLAKSYLKDLVNGEEKDWLRFLHGPVMPVLSGVVRSMVQATPGLHLVGGDYSAVEVRILFWAADEQDGVEAYRKGRKLYEEMASAIYRVPVTEVTSEQRFFGKTVILGAGYGLGAKKFREQLDLKGVQVSEAFAKAAIDAYREKYPKVPKFWRDVENATIEAVRFKRSVNLRQFNFNADSNFLFITLPSGKRLAYYKPEVRKAETPWGTPTLKLYHWDVHPITKKWGFAGTYGGKLVENICQAVSREIMIHAMHKVEASIDYELLLSVHDELLAMQPEGFDEKDFVRIMTDTPAWAREIPIGAEGWSGSRYVKG